MTADGHKESKTGNFFNYLFSVPREDWGSQTFSWILLLSLIPKISEEQCTDDIVDLWSCCHLWLFQLQGTSIPDDSKPLCSERSGSGRAAISCVHLLDGTVLSFSRIGVVLKFIIWPVSTIVTYTIYMIWFDRPVMLVLSLNGDVQLSAPSLRCIDISVGLYAKACQFHADSVAEHMQEE